MHRRELKLTQQPSVLKYFKSRYAIHCALRDYPYVEIDNARNGGSLFPGLVGATAHYTSGRG